MVADAPRRRTDFGNSNAAWRLPRRARSVPRRARAGGSARGRPFLPKPGDACRQHCRGKGGLWCAPAARCSGAVPACDWWDGPGIPVCAPDSWGLPPLRTGRFFWNATAENAAVQSDILNWDPATRARLKQTTPAVPQNSGTKYAVIGGAVADAIMTGVAGCLAVPAADAAGRDRRTRRPRYAPDACKAAGNMRAAFSRPQLRRAPFRSAIPLLNAPAAHLKVCQTL